MAIVFPQGFEVASQEPIDNRFVLTKNEMKNLGAGEMPSKYFCICKDDGKLYIWDSSFEKTEDLGRFKSYEEIFDLPEALDHAIAASLADLTAKFAEVLPGALESCLKEASGINVDSEGIGLNINEDLLQINEDNQLDLNISLIQAI